MSACSAPTSKGSAEPYHKPHVVHSMDTFMDGIKRGILVLVIGATIGAVEFGTTSVLAEMIVGKFGLIQGERQGR